MTKQQNQILTPQRRRAFAWVACFALLFGALAMPLTPTMPRPQAERLVWGNACTGAASPLTMTPIEVIGRQAPHHPDLAYMQNCACCTGDMPMVAVPTSIGFGLFALVEPVRFPVAMLVLHTPHRLQWPNRNPHASPRV